ncbi:hypothetical protein AVEN_115955-1 [Araneus ventricosus]|uniref:Integrase p58-like C-terminal domain-containing protein n=1 Tax=Araneus ventricosus TaxID=182803 RepID=A0A4Y2KZP0_ARAVE|nr:hypothetical protein AVEN_115955-1 [Araneus ventricosus]
MGFKTPSIIEASLFHTKSKQHQDADNSGPIEDVRKVGLSEKLLKKYFGPYQVVRKLFEVTYEVQDFDPLTKRRKIKDIVSVVRMKPYYCPDMQKDCLQDSPKIIQDTNPPRAEPESTSPEKKRMTYTGPTTRSRTKLAS